VVSCFNGKHASRQFLSFLLRLRQPQPRNRIREEERQPRTPPRQRPRLTQRLPLTQRLHRELRPRHSHRRQEPHRRWPRRELPHTSPHRMPCRKWPHRELRRTSLLRVRRRKLLPRELRRTSLLRVPRRKPPLRALRRTLLLRVTRLRKLARRARRKRPALPRSSLPARPADHPHRQWRGTRRRPGRRRLPLSNSRKRADGAAAVARELRNRANNKIWRSPGQAVLRHRQGAAAETPRHNKTWLRNRV
jgi:hypothetical protein